MAGKRLAVVVGINDYPGTGPDLLGCVNDANDWAQVLQARGYQVTQLLDAAATKAAIVGALRTAVGSARRYDRVVFTFSGHGTWLPDRNADEADQRDEALVCYDFRQGGLLLDEMFWLFPRVDASVRGWGGS